MREGLGIFIAEALPEMDPVISFEETSYGWRGLTDCGEVLEVRGSSAPPSEIIVAHAGRAIGRRQVTNDLAVDIDMYLTCFGMAVNLYRVNQLEKALEAAETACGLAPTLRARFNRAMILLAMGRWREGLREYWDVEQSKPFMRPQVEAALASGMRPWRGEPLTGRRLALLHCHGLGDSIMCLRYVHRFKDAVLVVPPELTRIAQQFAETSETLVDADFFCPLLHLPYLLGETPATVTGESYVEAGGSRRSGCYKIGVAWSVGKPSDGDYPRSLPLDELVASLRGAGELHSVQLQGGDEAEARGVTWHAYRDMADCAEMMSRMDEIVTVDTAALHLAGAIGHPRVTGLLSYWASWRWVAEWYSNVNLVRQDQPGDWGSALAKRRGS